VPSNEPATPDSNQSVEEIPREERRPVRPIVFHPHRASGYERVGDKLKNAEYVHMSQM
jgi:hypothetical protein